MGGRKWLLPCSVGLSAVNGLPALVPFVLLWLVVRTLLTAEGNLTSAQRMQPRRNEERLLFSFLQT